MTNPRKIVLKDICGNNVTVDIPQTPEPLRIIEFDNKKCHWRKIFLAHNRKILDMPMEIINMLNDNNITYEEAETILDVVRGMIKFKHEQCENDGEIVSRTEKIGNI